MAGGLGIIPESSAGARPLLRGVGEADLAFGARPARSHGRPLKVRCQWMKLRRRVRASQKSFAAVLMRATNASRCLQDSCYEIALLYAERAGHDSLIPPWF